MCSLLQRIQLGAISTQKRHMCKTLVLKRETFRIFNSNISHKTVDSPLKGIIETVQSQITRWIHKVSTI